MALIFFSFQCHLAIEPVKYTYTYILSDFGLLNPIIRFVKENHRMKMSSVVLLAVLTTVVACKSKYEKGFEAGEQQGYSEGYDDGYVDGEAYDGSLTYDDGFDDNGMLLTKMF